MKNPNGPYPGRQIFLGRTPEGRPAFAYLVTGRSPASRERKATAGDNGIIMGPTGNDPYDPLRHYTAVRYDNTIGLLAVTNGIQTDAIYETYKLLYHVESAPGKEYMSAVMTGAKFEPDSLHTPRISGLVMNTPDGKHTFLLSIVTDNPPAKTYEIAPGPGTMQGISTYNGDLADPVSFDVGGRLPLIELKAKTPADAAEFMYEISEATNNGEDIRVCAVAGVLSDDNRAWKLYIKNRNK